MFSNTINKPFKYEFIEVKFYEYTIRMTVINNTKMYVSYGLGTSLLRLRLFDHPSFNLYRIYSE